MDDFEWGRGARTVATVVVLLPPAIPALLWMAGGGFWLYFGPLMLLGALLAYSMGQIMWPDRDRSFALEIGGITLVVMLVATLFASKLGWPTTGHRPVYGDGQTYAHSAGDYFGVMFGIPLAGPSGSDAFLYPGLFFLATYVPGALFVRRWPYLWPVAGALAVFAFAIGANYAESLGVTWSS